MRRCLVLCLALAAASSGLGGPVRAHGVLALENGKWWDGRSFGARTMYSVDGVLRAAFDPEDDGEIDGRIDLEGGFVVPPMGDAHSHALASPQAELESRRFLARGTFYVQNPNSVRSWTVDARAVLATPETVDATFANGGLTAGGGHPIQIYDRVAAHVDGWSPERMAGEAYIVVDDLGDLERKWPEIVAGEPDFVKTYLERSEEHARRRDDAAFYGRRGLDPSLLPAIVAQAESSGLRVSTHVTSAADFAVAVAAGVDEIAHLPLEVISEDAAAAAAKAEVVVVTTTLSHRPTDGVEDLDALHRHNLRLLLDHGVAIVLGTDGDRSILEEAENLVRLGAVDSATAFDLLTRATPRWIFPQRAIGDLAAGSEASFLVVAGNPTVELGRLREIALAVKQGHVLRLDPDELPGIGQRLVHALMRDGADAALAEYRRLRAAEPDAWDFSEGQLNALGYAALQHDRAADAVAVFAFNAEQFPGSANVWDSLGDGQAALGDRPAAIASYRRALAIDARAEGTRAKLRALEGTE